MNRHRTTESTDQPLPHETVTKHGHFRASSEDIHAKERRGSESRAMDAWCAPGLRVEVLMSEEGLAGSRYMARVIDMDKARAFVEFEVRSRPPFAQKPSGPLDRQAD